MVIRLRSRSYLLLLLFTTAVLMQNCRQSINDRTDTSQLRSSDFEIVNFDFDSIRSRGSIKAIVENSSTGFFIYKGKPMGYEHDLLKLYADSRNLALEIVVTNSLDDAFKKLDEGTGDVIAFPLTITKERK